eukprot:TRINITY_DN4199_c0_g1_i1.p3 TRINITY_DN4199_c0_g1~~TRINITY_DN4199_c0_g1_i1.p3  ORF type:complete len:107 (+),score=30.07 TRINITY_DN4199_c0_g1_i1:51-323(+)
MAATSGDTPFIWQDREIRFDVPLSALELRKGEQMVDSIDSVEDTKGNNGEQGCLCITNLRIIWSATKYPKTNLSIGYNVLRSRNARTASA